MAGPHRLMFKLLLSLLVAGFAWSSEGSPLERVGRLDQRLIPEASGIVKSRRYPGIFWTHNDSGNPPLLFAISGDGRIVRQVRLAVPNVDWEDIAADDQGHLYLGDIGDNTRALPVRAIYRIDEPDPNSRDEKPVSASAVTFYASPAGDRFDAESLFYDRGMANLLAKYLDGREVELVTVPLDRPAPLFRPAQPRRIGRLSGFTEPATGAGLSDDGTLLAVCASTVTRVYRREDLEPSTWRQLAVVRYPALPVEGIAWDGRALVLVAEGGGLYRLAEQTWQAAIVSDATTLPARRAMRPRARAWAVWPDRAASRATRYWLLLPLGEGWGEGKTAPVWPDRAASRATRYWLPLPVGEGWGEGERGPQA